MVIKNKNKTKRVREISIEELEFSERFPEHIVETCDDKLLHIKVRKPQSSYEIFEIIINIPYVIVLGDWKPAVYCFWGMKEINQLNGIHNDYMESKCETKNHNPYFHKALQFYFDDLDKKIGIVKPKPIEVKQNDYEFPFPADHTIAICSENCINALENEYGKLKQCCNVQIFDSTHQMAEKIAFQHDNIYEGVLAKDTTGDLLSSVTVISQAKLKNIEEIIKYQFDFDNKEETLQHFFLFANVTRRYQFPLIVKYNNQNFMIAPLDREKAGV